jgi:hypothetical protein
MPAQRHKVAAASACGRQFDRNGAYLAATAIACPIAAALRSCADGTTGTMATVPRLRPKRGAKRRKGTKAIAADASPIIVHATGTSAITPSGCRIAVRVFRARTVAGRASSLASASMLCKTSSPAPIAIAISAPANASGALRSSGG